MSNQDYKEAILGGLLKKYNARCAKNIVTNRRIILKPTEIYRDYSRNNADISKKQGIHEAVSELAGLGLISADHLKFSDDIEKIYLSEENMSAIYAYLKSEYGIESPAAMAEQVYEIIRPYLCKGELVQKYCDEILAQMQDLRCTPDPESVRANLLMIDFLENNRENLYVREASMLVYGDSKWFENNNCEEICTFLRSAAGAKRQESERNDAILARFGVTPTEQEIFLKGNWEIEWEAYTVDISKLEGGIAIASGDMQTIKRITVHAKHVMTIENKTSYRRLKDRDTAAMYLGGFANRHQIEFLKKVIADNPDITYRHFGDIDVGGFFIHKHLCHETGKPFEPYCMGIEQLQDPHFRNCLRGLTDRDLNRIDALMEDDLYREVLNYMIEHNVKLEQEIVSYYLACGGEETDDPK